MRILLILLFLTGCGMTVPPIDIIDGVEFTFPSSNPIFNQYKNSFEDEYSSVTGGSINTSNIRINLVEKMDNSFIGVCSTWKGGEEIFIKESYWNVASEESKETLLYHELGHCALKKGHNNERYRGYNVSIMNSYNLPDHYIEDMRDSLFEELFNSSTEGIVVRIDEIIGD